MKTPVTIMIVLFFFISACSETVDSQYSSLDAARKENAIRTGLLPEWLPDSSRKITVAYDVSTNEKIMAFQYQATEGWNPLEKCKQIEPADPPKPHIARPWWPEDVPASSRHTYYTCEDGDSYLAAHQKSGQAFYWNTKI